jgi:subtilisin family serine protease
MFSRNSRVLAACLVTSLLCACGGGGGGGGGGTPPTSPPTSQPNNAFTCPTADSTTSTGGGNAPAATVARQAALHWRAPSSSGATGTIAVTYNRTAALGSAQNIAARETAAGATLSSSLDFSYVGLVTHVLDVPAAREDAVMAQLRSQPGVVSVNDAGARRYPLSVSSQYFTNDPYFAGFSTTVADTAEDGASATPPPPTYHVGPYEERADVPGQWDMHIVGLGYAMEYSQSGNGSGITNANALGSSSVKIAMIDTGQDTGLGELGSKIVYQKCFITGPNGQSVSNYTTDPWGHGSDTAGIAAADANNGLGFTGDGGNVVIYGYRVFPYPDSNCSNPNTNDQQCSATLQDIASAINDAVAHHVNVISMSLGGSCPDSPPESTAVQNAINAGVIVVAAAGNGAPGTTGLDAPACDPGVIAAGATSLDDGKPNGTSATGGNAGGTATNPVEYVASYSQYGSPAASLHSSSAWGIVAPGGDGANSNDADDLHWIENVWTSTPYTASDAGNCNGDYPSDTGPSDCRIDIAGTSMATPHVAGAAALILSVNSSYQSPSAMKALLCSTADDIHDPHEGCGRLNVYRAMAKALNDPSLP